MDLVEVAPNEKPPVCRIMDFGKYKYEKSKKRAGQSAGHHGKTKEIRLRPKTGEHDIGFKVKQAVGFLQHKDKVSSFRDLPWPRNGSRRRGQTGDGERHQDSARAWQTGIYSAAVRQADDLYDRSEVVRRSMLDRCGRDRRPQTGRRMPLVCRKARSCRRVDTYLRRRPSRPASADHYRACRA